MKYQISSVNQEAFRRMREQLVLKSYSRNTIKTYYNEFSQFLSALKNTPADSLTPERLRAYFLYRTQTLRLSENTIHSRLNAVKFYFEQALHREKIFFDEIPRPQKKTSLPKVIGKSDIVKIFSSVSNIKHLLMLKLCYGMGLRVSEIVNLKITDIDSSRMMVRILNRYSFGTYAIRLREMREAGCRQKWLLSDAEMSEEQPV